MPVRPPSVMRAIDGYLPVQRPTTRVKKQHLRLPAHHSKKYIFINLYFLSLFLLSLASTGIKELTKEYNSFDGRAVKKQGSQTREELIKADVAKIRKETRPVCLQAKEALKVQKEKLKGSKDAELRMREQSFRVTAQSYIESVKGYQNAHAMYEEAVRSTMRRHLDYTVPDYSAEQKEQIIDEGRAQEVCQAVMMNGVNSQLSNTYKDVSEQHKVR